MKLTIFTGCALCLLLAQLAFSSPSVTESVQKDWPIKQVHLNELDEEVSTWLDDFEGEPEWTTVDLTATGAKWHPDGFNAYQDGQSWWCGDAEIEGYENLWLQYLVTPSLDLTDATQDLQLTFMMYLDCESPVGAPDGYDGWDGANVWYTTDGGQTVHVLENPDPAYGSSSLFSFGHTFDLGEGIAGWNGDDGTDEWWSVSFDLSGFAGEENFRLNFAFCSDQGTATPETGDFGFFIDDILISDGETLFLENNAEDIAIPEDLIALEQEGNGNNWQLQTEEYYSAENAWWMEMGNSLRCALVSPSIAIPDTTMFPWTHLAYRTWCDMPDSDGDGDGSLEDYYTIDISTDGGENWEQLVYDYGVSDGNGNSLYSWDHRTTGIVNSVRTETIALTAYAGDEIKIRFVGITDNDDDGGEGTGLYIDDIELISWSLFEHDVTVQPLYVPFPTSVGYPVPAEATFTNAGYSTETFDASWHINDQEFEFDPGFTLEPGESETRLLDNNPDDGVDGWMPDETGYFGLFASHSLAGDENPDNDISRIDTVLVWPEGIYEYGYDDRNPEWTTSRFLRNEGPATIFQFDEELTEFNTRSVRVMWNSDLMDPIEYTLHVFDGEFIQEYYQEVVTVEPDSTYPLWQNVDLSNVEELQNLSGTIGVWFELTADYGFPHIVLSERRYGDNHHYNYDGIDLVDSDADWMIRIVVEPFTGVTENNNSNPLSFNIGEPYPNPFNSTTIIPFDLHKSRRLSFRVYNIHGREVQVIPERGYSAGHHEVIFRMERYSSGLYFFRIQGADGFETVRKLIQIR